MMTNSDVIITLCSKLANETASPLESSEWSIIAARLRSARLQPIDMLTFSRHDFNTLLNLDENETERIRLLFDRYDRLMNRFRRYADYGITIVTRADREYPAKLKAKLGNKCPPIFYCAGDISILSAELIGFTGSRKLDADDERFTADTARKVAAHGYGIVSGGARGADSIAVRNALACGRRCAEFLPDSLLQRSLRSTAEDAINNRQLVMLSAALPEDEFTAAAALTRNRYIYAQSTASIVVRSDHNKGGTWSGASYALRNDICPVFCREDAALPGNRALIQKGAYPITNSWDGNIVRTLNELDQNHSQLSFF